MRLIDIEAVLKAAELAGKECVSIDLLKDFEQVDAVPVVRCKDCVYYENPRRNVFKNCCRKDLLIPMNPNDYCSYGEKKEEAK